MHNPTSPCTCSRQMPAALPVGCLPSPPLVAEQLPCPQAAGTVLCRRPLWWLAAFRLATPDKPKAANRPGPEAGAKKVPCPRLRCRLRPCAPPTPGTLQTPAGAPPGPAPPLAPHSPARHAHLQQGQRKRGHEVGHMSCTPWSRQACRTLGQECLKLEPLLLHIWQWRQQRGAAMRGIAT